MVPTETRWQDFYEDDYSNKRGLWGKILVYILGLINYLQNNSQSVSDIFSYIKISILLQTILKSLLYIIL